MMCTVACLYCKFSYYLSGAASTLQEVVSFAYHCVASRLIKCMFFFSDQCTVCGCLWDAGNPALFYGGQNTVSCNMLPSSKILGHID